MMGAQKGEGQWPQASFLTLEPGVTVVWAEPGPSKEDSVPDSINQGPPWGGGPEQCEKSGALSPPKGEAPGRCSELEVGTSRPWPISDSLFGPVKASGIPRSAPTL